jgi:uncharacterized repeat protein (TIGR01451 family)/fimbrial isopeptide formation D2 family protein
VAVTGGLHGTTTENKYQYNAQNGTPGTTVTAAISAPTGAGSGSVCLPALTTTKSTSTPTVTNTGSGTAATYTIIVTNGSGLGTAQQVTVADELPTGFTYASTGSFTTGGGATRTTTVTPSVGEANPTWGTVAMPGGSTVTITFTVTIAASVAPGQYTNSAGPSYLDPQRNTTSGQASGAGTGPTALVEVLASADIAVTKTASAAAIYDGQEVTYTVTARNNGPDAASGVALTDVLPAGLEYVSSTVSQGSYETAEGIWTVGGLANAAAATLTVTARATKTGSITNTATKTAEEQNDPVAANDSASATVEVLPSADLATEKTVNLNNNTPAASPPTGPAAGMPASTRVTLRKLLRQRSVAPGGRLAYRLIVHNAGTTAAERLLVCDRLPWQTTVVSRGGGQLVSGRICFALALLAPGQSHFFAVVLRADSDASVRIVNRAMVTGANFPAAYAQASARVRVTRLPPRRVSGVTG